jgi:hypothetical protein
MRTKYDMKEWWMQAGGKFLYRPKDDVVGQTCYTDRTAQILFFTAIE